MKSMADVQAQQKEDQFRQDLLANLAAIGGHLERIADALEAENT